MWGHSRRAETHTGIRSTPRLITNTHQTRVTVLGLEAGGEPLQLPLFLDKRRKSKMKMQVANEHSSTFHCLSPNHLQSHLWVYTAQTHTESYWSASDGQRSQSELTLSLRCGFRNSPSVADEIQSSTDSPFDRLLTLLCLSDTLHSVNERQWLSFLSIPFPSSITSLGFYLLNIYDLTNLLPNSFMILRPTTISNCLNILPYHIYETTFISHPSFTFQVRNIPSLDFLSILKTSAFS